MKQILRWQRILILAMLFITVLSPLLLVSHKLKTLSSGGQKEFVEDLPAITYRARAIKLNAIEQGKSMQPKDDSWFDCAMMGYAANLHL